MAIRVAAWNVEGRLSSRTTARRGSPTHILAGVQRLNADIVVLPEAHHGTVADGIDEQLRQYGYSWCDVRYDDIAYGTTGNRDEASHLRVLSRLPIEEVHRVRFGNVRSLLDVIVVEPVSRQRIRVLAIHLDDRAEILRVAQVKAIARYLATNKNVPTILLGDFNAIWDGPTARVTRSRVVRWLARHAPSAWLRLRMMRFADMASGTTMKILAEQGGLHDADGRHRATATPKLYGAEWLPSIRIAQLDHILLSNNLVATHVAVAGDGGSDHRAISTTIRTKA
ncbi:Endonuclease/Exonuclease/phosphatase family protein [compost metagenome]